MNTDAKLKVGLVGIRNYAAARRSHLRRTGLFEFVAAHNRSIEPLKALEKEEGIPGVTSYEELLDTPGIEAVIISSGAKFHAEQVLKALNRGYHVFVEKPLCSTKQEMNDLLAAQKRAGLVVGVGHEDHKHRAVSLTIKNLIDSGNLGKIAALEKTTAHSGGFLIKPGDWRGDPEKNPGGMLFQCGVHAFHELMFYFGPIVEVSAMMRYDVHTTDTADAAICHLKFASGLIGALNAYHVTPYRHTLSIFGTKANLYRDDRYFDEGTSLFMQETHLDGKKEPKVPVGIIGANDECGSVRSFYEAVRNGGVPYPSIMDGARAVNAVFAAEESAKSGRPVKIEPINE